MSIKFTVKLKKEVSQVAFRPTLLSSGSFLNVAKDLENDFKEWATKDNIYTLYSPDSLEAMLFNGSSIAFSKEAHEEKDFGDLCTSKIINPLSKYIKEFGLREIRRIGYGVVAVLESELSYEELAEILFEKFYSSNEEIKRLSFEDRPRDVVFVLDGNKNGLKNHVELGPAKSLESLKRFNSTFTGFENKLELKENNLYISVDSFIDESIEIEKTSELLANVCKESKELLEGYLKYIVA